MSGDDTSLLSADYGLIQSPPASLDTQHIQTDHTNRDPMQSQITSSHLPKLNQSGMEEQFPRELVATT